MKTAAYSLVLSFCVLLTGGCSTVPPHKTTPEALSSQAVVEGFKPGIRSWADEPVKNLGKLIERRINLYREEQADYYAEHGRYPPMDYLAISGGGYDGAFGAGILCGWTKAGTRPEFEIVTGVSTGALIAPFAFAGPEYDDELKEVYTTLKSENIFMGDLWTVLDGITGGLALTDNTPLSKKIEETITPELFAKIAEENRKGRKLLIGTTNLEAQRGVIWDIGSLANSQNNEKGLKLFHKILLASSAIPGAFKPVFIDVVANGQKFQEIHVDGGVTAQVFLYSIETTRADRDAFFKSGIERNLYIIRNSKIEPEYESIEALGLVSISERSVATLIKNQGVGDLYRLYVGAERDGMNYHLTYLPNDFKEQSQEIFDPAYMSKLFEVGYQMGQKPESWAKAPPGVEYID